MKIIKMSGVNTRQSRLLRIMKAIFLSLFLFTGACFAADTYSQETSFSLELKNETVGNVINMIEKNSEFIFFYLNDVLDTNRSVSVRVKDQPVDKILDQLFEGTDITYRISDRQITVLKKETETNAPVASVPAPQQAPNRIITGTIKDNTGEPVIGANVVEKGTLNGTLTDIDGNFSFNVSQHEIQLEVTYIGYEPKIIRAKAGDNLSIVISEDNQVLDEVVVVGYGVQKKSSLTSAISNMKGDEVARNPVANISNTLAGRVSGVIARQSSGEPGSDGSDIYIRGRGTTGESKALVVVDGIPRENYSRLDPNSIESITILKDAAAVAPYGLAGANGVILVTTKKGKTGKATISYNGYIGFQNPTRMPEWVNSYEYTMLMNEAARNSGLTNMPFSDEEIANYKKTVDGAGGAHADRWPNSRGLRDIIKYNQPITNHSIDVSGGTEAVKYYISLAYMHQKSQFETIDLKRYNLQSRLDVAATKTTNVSLSLAGYVEDQHHPGESTFNLSYFTTRTPPINAIHFSNGLWGEYLVNSPVGALKTSGYRKNDISQIYTTLEVEQQLTFLKGLSVKGVFSYD
ncbi:MAG: SusC/RagA family TonB-linked outer membrane protein, partial [Tannerellaceae bacterium]|nr:SusC/RagA family TonB-linked outer membrane protein [Tannerellaceae bacterium]